MSKVEEFQQRVAAANAALPSREWPDGATVKLQSVTGYGTPGELYWAYRDDAGQLMSISTRMPLDHDKWSVLEERKMPASCFVAGLTTAFPGFIDDGDVNGGDLVAWMSGHLDEFKAGFGNSLLAQLCDEFPGFVRDEPVDGASLVDWINANFELAETSQSTVPSWDYIVEHFALDSSFQYSAAQQDQYYAAFRQQNETSPPQLVTLDVTVMLEKAIGCGLLPAEALFDAEKHEALDTFARWVQTSAQNALPEPIPLERLSNQQVVAVSKAKELIDLHLQALADLPAARVALQQLSEAFDELAGIQPQVDAKAPSLRMRM